MKTLNKLLCLSFIVLGSLSLTACNTVAGFGQDLSAGGKAITKTADRNK